MKRYVALLRGINISGKNKIAMSELKAGFAELQNLDIQQFLHILIAAMLFSARTLMTKRDFQMK